jgi:hypothetical protein
MSKWNKHISEIKVHLMHESTHKKELKTLIRYVENADGSKYYFYSEWVHKCGFGTVFLIMFAIGDWAIFDGVGILDYSFSTSKKAIEGLQQGGYKLVKTF